MRKIIVTLILICSAFTSLPLFAQSENYTERISKETDIDMILVHGGTFEMGSNDHEDEKPIHAVSLSSYYISKYEITQQQWLAVMNYYPSHFDNCPNCPVETVSWNEVQEFAGKLSKMVGRHYRLPTEAEWEYAAKGGSKSKHTIYSGSNNIDLVGHCASGQFMTEANRRTYPVGERQPNELGIYDMTGNVLEWCSDWYDPDYYKQRVANNPKGPATGKTKVYRGGSFLSFPQWSTVTCRPSADNPHPSDTSAQWITLGFRIVRDY